MEASKHVNLELKTEEFRKQDRGWQESSPIF